MGRHKQDAHLATSTFASLHTLALLWQHAVARLPLNCMSDFVTFSQIALWCRIVQFVIAIVTAVLFTAFLIYDLQLLMGGRTYELDPDEYVFASVTIYLDIINIFLSVLRIIGLVGE